MKMTKTLGIAIVGGLLSINTPMYAGTNSQFTADQTKEIQAIVHDYLIQNPEVLVDVSKALQAKQIAAMKTQAMQGIMANKADLFASKDDPIAGNPKGEITVIEFFDYQCPHCIDMTPVVDALIKKNPNVKVVFKEFPIFGKSSMFASTAAFAANKQGKYLEFHEAIMNAGQRLNDDLILKIAKDTGLDMDKLNTDMKDPNITKILNKNRKLAQALQMMGTPTFIVGPTDISTLNASNTTYVPGQTTEEILQKAIDNA